MRDDARAGLELALELRLDPLVDGLRQEQGNNCCVGEVGLEEIPSDEGDLVGHAGLLRVLRRLLDEVGVQFDTNAAGAVLLRRGDDDGRSPDPRS